MTHPLNAVTIVAAAPSDEALAHFTARLRFETDCWDTHDALSKDGTGFVVLDVRHPDLYRKGHVPGALNLPISKMTERKMGEWPQDTLFVVYCAGPHCNGANKAAVRLATLGLPVKEMIGGITGWLDEGFTLSCTE